MGNISTEVMMLDIPTISQLRDIIRDQLRINDEFGKKIHATDKLLENIRQDG
jgi:hypothetical protein